MHVQRRLSASRAGDEIVHPGQCLCVQLGEFGSDYLLLTSNLNGEGIVVDQSRDWTYGPTGVPSALRNQIKKISAKEGIIKDCIFGPNGEWFCKSRQPGASGDFVVWDVPTEECSDFLSDHFQAQQNDLFIVCFGPRMTYVVIDGHRKKYLVSKNSPYSLKQRLAAVFSKPNGIVHSLCLFRNGGYFILDSMGCFVQSGPTAIQEELMGPGDVSQVINVTVSGDDNWIITKRQSFLASTGVCRNLESKLQQYYKTFTHRKKNLAERILMEKEILREREVVHDSKGWIERKKRNETARNKKEAVNRIKKACYKGLKLNSVVTVLGFSSEPGDCMVDDVQNDGLIVVSKLKDASERIQIDDPRRLVLTEIEEYPSRQIINLVKSTDKFEAAVTRFPCSMCLEPAACECSRFKLDLLTRQSSDTSASTRSTTQNFEDMDTSNPPSPQFSERRKTGLGDDGVALAPSDDNSKRMSTCEPMDRETSLAVLNKSKSIFDDERVLFLPVFEEQGEYLQFDEYKCAEKIDLRRLQLIVQDLQTDQEERQTAMRSLMKRRKGRSKNTATMLRRLQRCYELECVAEALYAILKEYPISPDLCVVHEVEYEHRDIFSQGRLFSAGINVKAIDGRFPRNTTLQSMLHDWRIPLVGAFGHYVDCQNSQVRILCCLAKQMKMAHLTPKLTEYRDNRDEWISRISSLHKVTEEAAKRWPNIIIGGGLYVYKTWLDGLGVEDSKIEYVRSFAQGLAAEIAALTDEILLHPRFQWACANLNELRMEMGCSDFAVKTILLSRVLEWCENEILSILQRSFHFQGWITRSKIFDSLIVEKGPGTHKNLPDVIDTAENACKLQGWDVVLVEKSLHGKEDEGIKTIVEAREVMRELRIGTQGLNQRSRSKAKRMASGFDIEDIESLE